MTRLGLRYTPEARLDLIEIGDRLPDHTPRAAERVLDRIAERCRQLVGFPNLGRPRPTVAPEARSIGMERYLIFYRLTESEVVIVRVVDGRRDLSSMTWVLD